MTKSGKSKCLAATRVGINPTPTLAECCNHFDNPLIAKVLHTSAVVAECCNRVDNPLIIIVLHAAVEFPHSTTTNEIENRYNTAMQGLLIFVRTGHLAVENGLADETATEGAHTRE